MFARAASGTVMGIDAHEVIVESQRANGLPGMAVIGLARGAAKEAAVRVRAAIVAMGVSLGTHKLVVNMLPAELPKEDSALDLALAVSLLASGGKVSLASLKGRRFYGELSLGGAVQPVQGAVLLADLARRLGDEELCVPAANAAQAAIIPGIRIIGIEDLQTLLRYLNGEQTLQPADFVPPASTPDDACLADVRGQRRAKRALEIAAAGNHNLLMVGPPGSGKTMLARRLVGLLPPLDAEQSIEVTRIHSAARSLQRDGLVHLPPFRSPHHTASEPALCGGGTLPRPGEITLAHRGVLFLDELPEFSRRALESLREPLEEGCIQVARARMSLRFPARFLLVAAMNPCPCGYFQDGKEPHSGPRKCICSFDTIQRYRSRISGPLLDRIDLHVSVQALPYRDFAQQGSGEPSAAVRQRVAKARKLQIDRLGVGCTNGVMQARDLKIHARVDGRCVALLEEAIQDHGLSTRAVQRILKVARTVADLQNETAVTVEHVREAISFRLLDYHIGEQC